MSVSYDEIRNRHFFDVKRACETKSVFDKINVKEVMVIERKITFQKQSKERMREGIIQRRVGEI